MSLLKVILHRWNKTAQSYDKFHPETESAQITDWHQGIVNTLASTALGTLVNTLTSDSLLATMIQKVLTATGVKYNIAQNGYVCLGSFFGGLIIQWGIFQITNGSGSFTLPLSSTMLNGYIQHCGVSAQYNGLSGTRVVSSLNTDETLSFLAICK